MRRHDLVYITPGTPFRFLCAAEIPEIEQAVSDWVAAGRPLVAARQPYSPIEVQLGLTLPQRLRRQRVSCIFPRASLKGIRPPLRLHECAGLLSDGQFEALNQLLRALTEVGAQLGFYGSLSWEALSGERYRHERSDIDMVIDLPEQGRIDAMLAAVNACQAQLDCRLDGELRFPGDRAVAWRELAQAWGNEGVSVLVKGGNDVDMMTIAQLMSRWAEPDANAATPSAPKTVVATD